MLGFVADDLKETSTVLVISMFPTQYEATKGEARVGMTVEEYERDYAKYAGPVVASYANVVRCRGPRGVKLPTGKKLKDGALYCRQYDSVPPLTQLVVFQGIDVARHLAPTVKNPIGWRGFLLQRGLTNELSGVDEEKEVSNESL